VITTGGPGEESTGQDFDQPPGVEIGPANGALRLGAEMGKSNSEAGVASRMTLHRGVVSSLVTQFRQRHRDQEGSTKPIGELLIDSGFLKRTQLEEILRVQATSETWGPRKRFGEIARELGLVEPSRIDQALARQFDLPSLPSSDHTFAPELLAARETNHPEVEVLRGVRERIARTWLKARGTGTAESAERRSGGHAVAIVSAQRGEGRSFVAANLGVTFAQSGRRTLVIDADLRQPRQHQLFQVDDSIGLSTLLAGRSGTESVVRIEAMPDLYLLPAGPIPPSPQDLLARPELRWLLFNAEEQFDVVLVDTPACSDGLDAESICRRTRAATLVVRGDQTAARTVQEFVAALREADAQVLGLVFNR
jgi:receptor protein-tyrosine kinase